MQPYFMPYVGYWRLMATVDKFILLDDVNFIKGGWINRNRIEGSNGPAWITIPLIDASPNRSIRDLDIVPGDRWKRKMKSTVLQSYSRNEGAQDVLQLFCRWIDEDAAGNLSQFLYRTISDMKDLLGLGTEIIPSSSIFDKGTLTRSERIIGICKRIGADVYINAPGGRKIYDQRHFQDHAIKLEFLDVPQLSSVETMSILHLLLTCGPSQTARRVASGSLAH